MCSADITRVMEMKCLEMQQLMREQGYSLNEVEHKIFMFRKMLMEKNAVLERGPIKEKIYESSEPMSEDNSDWESERSLCSKIRENSHHRSQRHSLSRSPLLSGGRHESRSPSIRRRRGSPSHLERRRITSWWFGSENELVLFGDGLNSARKRPIPYYRPSPSRSDSSDSWSSRSLSPHPRSHRSRSKSVGRRRKHKRNTSRTHSYGMGHQR